jgi:hypothetical protein
MRFPSPLSSILSIVPAIVLTAAAVDAAGPPRQALVEMSMPAEPRESRRFSTSLEGGDARVTVIARNNAGRTAGVTLHFRYTIPPDTIALDEIIDRIVVEAVDDEGVVVGRVAIDPNEVNLNPNGPRLKYHVTVYRPEQTPYRVRARVFGNYE